MGLSLCRLVGGWQKRRGADMHPRSCAEWRASRPCAASFPPQLVLSFTSNWTPAGGVDDYANFTGVTHNQFFTNEPTKVHAPWVSSRKTKLG